MAEMYNEEIKRDFLKEYPEKTAETYSYVFARSKDTEEVIGRDLYTFSTDEIVDVLKNSNHTTINALRHTWNIIKLYLDWAAKYRGNTINQAKNIPMDELRNYLDTSKKLYLNEDEIIEIENEAVNAQDVVAVRLIFEGVGGYQLSEICSLNYNDVNWNSNKLKLKEFRNPRSFSEPNESILIGERELEVSNRCIAIIEKAYKQPIYYKGNGESRARNPEAPLQESDYIVKNIQTGLNKNFNGVDRHTIYRRISTLSESFEYPYLTPKNLEKSGMLKYAHDLYKESGKLDNEELEKIAERFNMKKVKINGSLRYNFTTMREYINLNNINDLYPTEDKE